MRTRDETSFNHKCLAKIHTSVHKLEEVKARRQTIGAIKCILTTKSGTLLSFLFGKKISFIEISARTIHFPKKLNSFTTYVRVSPKALTEI